MRARSMPFYNVSEIPVVPVRSALTKQRFRGPLDSGHLVMMVGAVQQKLACITFG